MGKVIHQEHYERRKNIIQEQGIRGPAYSMQNTKIKGVAKQSPETTKLRICTHRMSVFVRILQSKISCEIFSFAHDSATLFYRITDQQHRKGFSAYCIPLCSSLIWVDVFAISHQRSYKRTLKALGAENSTTSERDS